MDGEDSDASDDVSAVRARLAGRVLPLPFSLDNSV